MSELGIFETFGVSADDIAVPTGGPGPGTYDAVISGARVEKGTKRDENAVNLILSYKIPNFEFAKDEYFGLPQRPEPWDKTTVIRQTPQGNDVTEDSNNRWLLGILKKRLLSLGVPEDKANKVKPEHLIGIPVVLTLVKSGEYTNIARNDGVRIKQESSTTLQSPVTPTVADSAVSGFKPAWG